jgi:hypothetical protein
MSQPDSSHLFEQSSSREKVIEHLFVGELLRTLWCARFHHVEVLRSEFDGSGYDIVIDCNRILRHIQLKSSYFGSKISNQKINIELSNKPSGCVIWIFFDKENLKLTEFRWFGNPPGQPLPDLGSKFAKHTKGNAQGEKLVRQRIRLIAKAKFDVVRTMDELADKLFGQNDELQVAELAA